MQAKIYFLILKEHQRRANDKNRYKVDEKVIEYAEVVGAIIFFLCKSEET